MTIVRFSQDLKNTKISINKILHINLIKNTKFYKNNNILFYLPFLIKIETVKLIINILYKKT